MEVGDLILVLYSCTPQPWPNVGAGVIVDASVDVGVVLNLLIKDVWDIFHNRMQRLLLPLTYFVNDRAHGA